MPDLDYARKVIAAERCERDPEDPWCLKHGCLWPLVSAECKWRPEVVDVAADLLAAVERVRELHVPGRVRNEGEDTEFRECATCEPDPWPCETIRALDGGDDADR